MNKNQDILSEDESLEKEFPLLHSISKENPFSVPQDYFDSLPSEIIEKCREQVVSNQWKVDRKNLISYSLYLIAQYKWRLLTVAGCVAVICIFAIRFNNREVSYEAMAQNIPDSLIVEHLDKNITYISESTLEELSEGIPLGQEPENSSASYKSKSDSANGDEDIISYLMNNNINVSEIVNVQ